MRFFFSPGPILNPVPPLGVTDYQTFKGFQEAAPGQIFPALEKLLPRLSDELVEVERAKDLFEPSSSRVSVFQHPEHPSFSCYVLVTGKGQVLVGRTDDLGAPSTLRLGSDFDAVHHEVLSVSVTSRLRPMDTNLDLFIVTRTLEVSKKGAPRPEPRAFHGLIGFEDDRPVLCLPKDEAPENPEGWAAGPAGRLPQILKEWRLHLAPDVDPFALPAELSSRLDQKIPSQDLIAVSLEAICHASGARVCLETFSPPIHPKRCFDAREEVTLLTTMASGGAFFGVFGFDSRQLVAFRVQADDPETDGALEQDWQHHLAGFPSCVAFLPSTAGSSEHSWPDLLVSFRDGGLARLRHVGRKKLWDLWDQLWSNLGAPNVDQRLALVATIDRKQTTDARRRVLFFGAVEAMLQALPQSSADDKARWLKEIPQIFLPEEDYRILASALQPLLTTLRRVVRNRKIEKACKAFLLDLLYKIYHRQDRANIEILSQIDRVVRSVEPEVWEGLPEERREFREVISRSRRNRQQIWSELTTSSEPELEVRARRCAYGPERWASAYLAADAVHVGRWQDRLSVWDAEGFAIDGTQWIAVTTQKGLTIHAWDSYGLVDLEPVAELRVEHDRECLVLRAPGPEALLLFAEDSKLRLLRFDPARPREDRLEVLSEVSQDAGSFGPWSLVPGSDGSGLGIAACQKGRRSSWLVFQVQEHRLLILNNQPAELPKVSCLDLARKSDGTHILLAGSSLGGPVNLYTLGADHNPRLVDSFWPSAGGALATCFNQSLDPTLAVIGDVGGYVWCARLPPSPNPIRLAWVYQFDAAIRSVARTEHGGEERVLIGSDAGKLALLRFSDGARLWTHRLQSPVRRFSVATHRAHDLIITLRAGWLCTFEHVQDSKRAFEMFDEDLQILAAEARRTGHRPFEDRPDEDLAQIVLDLKEGKKAQDVFSRTPGREHRARFLRYLVQEAPEEIRQQYQDLLPKLSFREMHLLLHYAQDPAQDLEAKIGRELESRSAGSFAAGDRSFPGACAAWAALLQRLARRRASLEWLIQVRPRAEIWYESQWLRLEMAWLFLHTIHSTFAPAGTDRLLDGTLLSSAFPHLLFFPPHLVESCVDVLPNRTEDHQDFLCLKKVVDHLLQEKPTFEPAADVARVEKSLAKHPTPVPITQIVHGVFRLVVAWNRFEHREKEEFWPSLREPVLAALRGLSTKILAEDTAEAGGPDRFVIERLRSLLPAGPMPEDTAPHEERDGWLKSARDALLRTSTGTEGELDISNRWIKEVLEGVLVGIRKILGGVIENEETHLQTEVRPFLRLRASPLRVLDNHEVILQIEVVPEGRRWLKDVAVRVDAGITGGLQSPKGAHLSGLIRYSQFQSGGQARDIDLQGFVSPDAQEVRVLTLLESGDGYRHRQIWSFVLTHPSTEEAQSLGGAQPYQLLLEEINSEVTEKTDPVVLLVLDPVLGRDAFSLRWQRERRGPVLDLDRRLAHFGAGGQYSVRGLDQSLVIEAIESESVPDSQQPILITSMDQIVHRWLKGEAPGALASWLVWLRAYGEAKRSPQIIWVTNSTHAAQLRPLGLGGIPTIWAHRPPRFFRHAGHALQRTEFWDQLVEEGSRVLFAGHRDPRHDLIWRFYQDLGGDLHLISLWLLWALQSPEEARRGLKKFFKELAVERRLAAELKSLGSLDLLNALVGATTLASVPFSRLLPGLIAAEDFFSSTTKQAAKHLQAIGTPFTRRSIEALRADAHPPVQVKVQGFGTEGTFATEGKKTRLLQLAQRRPKAERTASFQNLAELGIGTWSQGIFRTSEPYRTRIRALYDRYREVEGEIRDRQVYEAILGQGRTPLEGLSLAEIADVPGKELQPLLPEARSEELRVLQNLARQWRGDGDTPGILRILQSLYKGRLVWRPASSQDRWDRFLLNLSHPCFGVGRFEEESQSGISYPTGYHYWLDAEAEFQPQPLVRAIERTMERRQEQWRKLREGDSLLVESQWAPRIVLTGPGAEAVGPDPERRFAVLKSADYLQAAWEGELSRSLLRRARVQMRLTSISPFQTSGPISPGSKFFFGREPELTFIKTRVRKSSIFIVGSRRVGKTSVLNQIRHWARKEPDLEPVYIDLQKARTEKAFLQAARVGLRDLENPEVVQHIANDTPDFDSMVRAIQQKTGRVPLLLLNEIDGLAIHADEVLTGWRSLHESGLARFVMSGYTTVSKLGDPGSPFFNWTVGTDYNGQALTLTTLEPPAAEKLLDMLVGDELGLHWNSAEEKEKAIQELLDRSYRIPWVLQVFGQLLVERLENERRGTLYLQDVEDLLDNEGGIVWRYFNGINFDQLGSAQPERARRPGYQLLLYCLVRQRYFLGQAAPIRDPDLRWRKPLDFGFTIAEAKEIVQETLSDLLTQRKERKVVEDWFERLDLDRALALLTLTLTLEPDPVRPGRFAFLLHILPRELQRRCQKDDPYLDNLIVETAVEYWQLVQAPQIKNRDSFQ